MYLESMSDPQDSRLLYHSSAIPAQMQSTVLLALQGFRGYAVLFSRRPPFQGQGENSSSCMSAYCFRLRESI
jgi:hypothetical protein